MRFKSERMANHFQKLWTLLKPDASALLQLDTVKNPILLLLLLLLYESPVVRKSNQFLLSHSRSTHRRVLVRKYFYS